MKNKIILIILVIVQSISFSQTTEWVKSFGGPDSDKGISVGTDTLGHVFISGFLIIKLILEVNI